MNVYATKPLPIPMTEDAVHYVSERILRVQDILGQKLVLENVSTYLMPHAEMSEAEFVAEVIQRSDCELLLDVNNVYVNSINHQSNAYEFIKKMPQDRIRYLHIAGHEQVGDDLSGLADAILHLATHWCWQRLLPKVHSMGFTNAPQDNLDEHFAIVAYGKLGGLELGYGSDLDLVFIYENTHERSGEIYAMLVRKLINGLFHAHVNDIMTGARG